MLLLWQELMLFVDVRKPCLIKKALRRNIGVRHIWPPHNVVRKPCLIKKALRHEEQLVLKVLSVLLTREKSLPDEEGIATIAGS